VCAVGSGLARTLLAKHEQQNLFDEEEKENADEHQRQRLEIALVLDVRGEEVP
jgi:hypothetical protein